MEDKLIDIADWAKGIIHVGTDNIQDIIITISTVVLDQQKQIVKLKEESIFLKTQVNLLTQIVDTQSKSIQILAGQ